MFDVTDDIVFNDAPADTVWGGDKVEIYISAQGKARQIIVTPPGAGNVERGAIRVWDKNLDIKGLKTAGIPTEKGYIVQIAVPRTVLADQGVARLGDNFKYSVDISDADSIYMKGVPHVPVKTDLIPFGNMANYTLQNTELWADARFTPMGENVKLETMMPLDPEKQSETFRLRQKLTDPAAFSDADLSGFSSLLGNPKVTAADATYAMIGLSLAATPKKDYVAVIAPFLKDANPDLRSTAMTTLARLKFADSDAALRAAALSDPIMANRCNALEALGIVGKADLVDFLKTYLKQPNRHPYEISIVLELLG